MGRKKLKKQLGTTSKTEQIKVDETSQMKTFAIVVLSIIIALGAGYLIVDNIMDNNAPVVEEEIDVLDKVGSSKILAEDALSQKEPEYAVFFINGEEGKEELNEYYSALELGLVTAPVYVVFMSESINSQYLVDDSEEIEKYGDYASIEYNKEPTNISELEVYQFPTVLSVVDGQVAGYYVGSEFYEAFGITDPNAATSY